MTFLYKTYIEMYVHMTYTYTHDMNSGTGKF